MTTINDISDLARVLREHPEWRDTIRGLVLGEEISRLPEQLAAFIDFSQRHFELFDQRLERVEAGQATLVERADGLDHKVDKLDNRVNRLENKVDELDHKVNKLDNKVDRLTGRVDNGLGANYEFKAEKAARSLAYRYLDLSAIKVLQGARTGFNTEFASLLDDARKTGLLTPDQFQELLNLDLVFAAKRNSDDADVHVVAEVSITAGDSDIERAARRAPILSAVTTHPVFPAVVSASVDDKRKARAAQQNVTVMLLPEN